MSEKFESPVYAKIALELAGKIASGELAEGQKITGRSGLAGIYHVSPETIRRAILLLEDVDIVATRAGSGTIIVSRRQAQQYVERHQQIDSFQSIRDEIRHLMRQKAEIETRVGQLIDLLEEQASRLQNLRPVYPREVQVPENSPLIGKTINDAKFWQNTGGTIIAIRRGVTVLNSPGPYAQFFTGDILYITGDDAVEARTADFLLNG